VSTYTVTSPTTNETTREFAGISDDELRTAIDRAHAAHESWKSQSIADRVAIVRKVAAAYRTRASELGSIISREMGKPVTSAAGEVSFSASIYEYYADHAEAFLADEPLELLGGTGSAVIRRASLGVLLGIMPWNYPYYQVARFSAPNLLAGNTILLKPAPQCPESAAVMQEIFIDAGLPAGVFTSVLASNEQIEWVIGDSRVRGVSLTGSGVAGAAVAEIAGRHLKKVVLELGGSDPFVVLSTADMDALVEQAVGARMPNAGQACNAAKRFIVVAPLYDEFLAKFVARMSTIEPGDPADSATTVGPLSSLRAAERLEAQVAQAIADGATVELGGQRKGSYFAPTVLTNVSRESRTYAEEFFGPVAQIFRVADEREAVDLANDTEFGLGSYLFTEDTEQAERVADQIEAGMVFINTTSGEGTEIPFGGVKNSGFGRELGRAGIDEFVNKKLIRTGAR
jgi:succinate-semialdehyde dehydrogenase / glutarate-semialdehyde dehydrogenase